MIGELHLLLRNLMGGFQGNTLSLNKTQIKSLFMIQELPDPCMGNICRRLGIEKGSFTTVADSLIQQKLVKRVPDPEDRRKSLLTLTEQGEQTLALFKTEMKAHLDKRLSVLEQEELQRLEEAFAVIQKINKKLKETRA